MTTAIPAAQAADPALAALRERGAHRFDPVRFRFIEALARRATAHGGDVRRILDGKLARSLADYVQRYEKALPATGGARQDAVRREPLAGLLRYIASQSSDDADEPSAAAALARVEPPAELKALRQFRSTWSRLGVDRQLTQSLARLPQSAGPLNSHLLVLRSLQSMREASPDYLERFMAYVDALLWLDQASGGAAVPAKAARGDGDKRRKPGRGSA